MSIPHRHSRPANIAASERTFFITASTWEKRNLLQSSRTAELFFRTIQDYRAQRKFLLNEFVVMPNHVHLLITVDIDMTIEKAVQLIKGGFSFQARKLWESKHRSGREASPRSVFSIRIALKTIVDIFITIR